MLVLQWLQSLNTDCVSIVKVWACVDAVQLQLWVNIWVLLPEAWGWVGENIKQFSSLHFTCYFVYNLWQVAFRLRLTGVFLSGCLVLCICVISSLDRTTLTVCWKWQSRSCLLLDSCSWASTSYSILLQRARSGVPEAIICPRSHHSWNGELGP